MSTRVIVVGDGGWGLVVAKLLAKAGHDTRVWGHDPEYVRRVASLRQSPRYLSGVELPAAIRIEPDFAVAAADAEIALSVVPTQFLRATWIPHATELAAGVPVLSLTKGIENRTLQRPTEVLAEVLGPDRDYGVLSGPSHAEEVARGLPTTVVAASPDERLARRAQDLFSTERFRVYTTDDVLGVELGGALKNVIALAAGMAHGLGFGDNSGAALITRGMVEIRRLGVALGARPETFSGLSGIGDLITTCISPYGRNRSVGERIGKGETLTQILASMEQVAEGVRTTESAIDLAERLGVELPITQQVGEVLFREKPPMQAVVDLMMRDRKSEREELE